MNFETGNNRILYLGFAVLAILVHLTGLLNELFISDSALYAGIAKEMALSNNFLDLTFGGTDWLDKPHFQFWVTALSYKLFGINPVAFKLPAILFTLLALVYTYRLASELYNRETALLSVLILATALHLVISNNDVRAEPILTGLIIASIYHYHRLLRDFRAGPLLLASFFTGLAVMTKGLFALIPVMGCIGGELILKRNWKALVSWRWVLSVLLIVFFITPELFALYRQFDMHPEKVVFGRTGVSGIRFFLWDSQFGRFFNTGPIRGSGDPFFFLHTLLWAFLPWSVLMYYAVYRKIRDNIPGIDRSGELLTISGILFTLIIFSASSFQLPHYTNVIFPLLAIPVADFIQGNLTRAETRFYRISQWVIIILTVGLLGTLHVMFRPEPGPGRVIALILLATLTVYLVLKYTSTGRMRLFYLSCLISLVLTSYLNLVFYPELLGYQSGIRAARYVNTHFPGKTIRTLAVMPFCLQFYSEADVKYYPALDELVKGETEGCFLLFTGQTKLDSLREHFPSYQVLEEFEHYRTTMLTGRFLNHKTRKEALRKQYLLNVPNKN